MSDPLEAVGPLSALADATRRDAYAYVSAQDHPVGRDEVATRLGIGRTLAAYHLDRLAKAGLLSVAYARRSGRTGPGAGRPAKLYERTDRELDVSLPPRDYGLAAHLLAHAAALDVHGGTRRALRDTADSVGREIAASAESSSDLQRLLRERGYEPYDDGGVARLRHEPQAARRSHRRTRSRRTCRPRARPRALLRRDQARDQRPDARLTPGRMPRAQRRAWNPAR
jgi:predicted ArsR family transcriptional regulator